jgi:hypothetical protein
VKPVERSELLGLGAYEQIRDQFRNRMIEAKRTRRVLLGPNMSMVFENHDTVLLQIQEMLRTERITDERAIAHEISTYNELIPPAGGLSATHFIEYDDKAERTVMLAKFSTLRDKLHLTLDGQRFTARFATHFGEEPDRIPAVNYLSFDVGVERAASLLDPAVRASLLVDHPDYRHEVELSAALRRELAHDLG